MRSSSQIIQIRIFLQLKNETERENQPLRIHFDEKNTKSESKKSALISFISRSRVQLIPQCNISNFQSASNMNSGV